MRFQTMLALRAAAGLAAIYCYAAIFSPVAVADVAPPRQPPIELRGDATLFDLFFLSAEQGWAAGDRGTIWRTDDGGRTWHLQPSLVGCRLESIHFTDPQHGWAVGGWSASYLNLHHGVVLVTDDGGRNWQRQETMLPRLKMIRMFGRRGWLLTAPAESPGSLHSSELLHTLDGGQTWTAAPTGGRDGWIAASAVDDDCVLLASDQGQLARSIDGQFQGSGARLATWRKVRQITMIDRERGWLVGDGGLIRTTTDGGRTWHDVSPSLPPGVAEEIDFSAVAAIDRDVWVAGSPGSIVLRSADAGKTWTVGPTGSNLPIHDLAFVDRRRGWAAGALGTILATRDGGLTWNVQRSGGRRASVLALVSRPSDAPFELLAQLSGNDGRLGVVAALHASNQVRREGESIVIGREGQSVKTASGARDEAARLSDATTLAGGSWSDLAWRFPIGEVNSRKPFGQTVERWNELHQGRWSETMEAYLARQIRIWRPEVVVTHGSNPQGDRPLQRLVSQAALRAIALAADANYPLKRTAASLAPWSVKKTYAALSPGKSGSIELATSKLAPRLSETLGAAASRSRELLHSWRASTVDEKVAFRLIADQSRSANNSGDFFNRTSRGDGPDEARRLAAPHQGAGLGALNRSAAARREVERMLSAATRPDAWLGDTTQQIVLLTRDLVEDEGAEIVFDLAVGYERLGRWREAAEAYEVVLRRWSRHRLAEPALDWLMCYSASAEAARLVARNASPARTAQGQAPRDNRTVEDTFRDPNVRPASGESELPGDAALGPRAELAPRLDQLAQRTFPLFASLSSTRYQLATAYRRSGADAAETFYRSLSASNAGGPWSRRAAAELWLAKRVGEPPLATISSRRAIEKPFLDGKLDDDVWRRAAPIELVPNPGAERGRPAVVRLAHDDQFFYLAVDCPKAAGVQYPEVPKGTVRSRDADLSLYDRVELRIDVDRDYDVSYRLAVDYRGWTHERCWRSDRWNPNWHVARGATDDAWQIEAAIEIDDLADRPTRETAWAVSLKRTIPGVGVERETQAVAGDSWRLLLFE